MSRQNIFSLSSAAGKVVLLSSECSLLLKQTLETRGCLLVDSLQKKNVDLLIVKHATDGVQQQHVAISMGIPVLTEAYVNAHLISPLKKKRDADKENPPKQTRSRSASHNLGDIQKLAQDQANLEKARKKVEEETVFLNKVIALEGNIGAGKSTLCSKFKKLAPLRCSIYKEIGNEQFLKLFYSDPGKYGFAYQWGMLKTRRFQLANAQQDLKYGRIPPKQFYFWDRSLIGDYIFALWNHLLGGISKEEMIVYEDEFGATIKDPKSMAWLSLISCFIFLNDEPAKCKARVENVRGNDSESGIPLSYYEGIDDIHFELLVRRIMIQQVSPVMVLSWGQYDEETKIWENLSETMQGLRTLPTVKVLDSFDPSSINGATEKVYSEAMVKTMYKTISDETKVQAVLAQLKKITHIYIPEDIMTISLKEKGLQENDYNVMFYQNAYKRVVLWHLSVGHNVTFFPVEDLARKPTKRQKV